MFWLNQQPLTSPASGGFLLVKREGIPWRGNLVSINLTQQPELGWGQLMPFVLLNYSSLFFSPKQNTFPLSFGIEQHVIQNTLRVVLILGLYHMKLSFISMFCFWFLPCNSGHTSPVAPLTQQTEFEEAHYQSNKWNKEIFSFRL